MTIRPLAPDDLLIRYSPVENDRWLSSASAAGALPVGSEGAVPETSIPLERFQALEHILRDSPLNVDPYMELARIYLKDGRWTDARRVLDAGIKRFPENEEAIYLCEEAQLARSLQLLSQAQAEYDAQPNQLTEEPLHRCHVELNVLREKVCRRRLECHPERTELNMPLATALENLGNYPEAIECLKQAVVQPNLRAAAALQLGQLFERAKRIPEALSAYRRAALFRVPMPNAEIKLRALAAAANLAQRSGLNDSAIRYVEMLLELQPENESVMRRLSELKSLPL